jgi:hypothetical protein
MRIFEREGRLDRGEKLATAGFIAQIFACLCPMVKKAGPPAAVSVSQPADTIAFETSLNSAFRQT